MLNTTTSENVVMALVHRVAARYKKKLTLDSGSTVYQYSERQIALRHSEKAKRLEALGGKMTKLRAKVKADITGSDEKKAHAALAVALMDATYERVGNSESAEERGHFGVTEWRKSHIKFSGNKATITYTGKSGVDHKKSVDTPWLVSALKKAVEDTSGDDSVVKVQASDVNNYLSGFDVTSKDLRGFHANTLMRNHLKAVRKGKLPEDKKEREAQLKEEFKKALELAAEDVGHEASTLQSNYLTPGLEDLYTSKGEVMEDMVK